MQKRNLIHFFLLYLISFAAIAKDIANIKSVNFIQEGEVSKLIIDFDKEVFAERTHIKDDKQIILDLKNVKADDKFLRGIDTSEFSGSSVFVSPYKKPGTESDLRFAIQLRDNVRSFVEKKRNRVILHIENRFGVFSRKKLEKADTSLTKNDVIDTNEKINIPKSGSIEDILENLTQSGLKKYIGKKISINVNNVGYREILRMIADISGFNIIIDEEINNLRPLTLSLTNIPWDQALDTIMSLGNLVGEKHSNILTIKTAAKALEEKKRELENKNNNLIQEPLVTKIFPLSFATVADMTRILDTYKTPERGSIQSDIRTNNLIVKDTVEVIERMKKIIETLDTQTPQVLIESKIVEAREDYEFRAGLGRRGLSYSYDPLTPSANLATNSGSFSFSSAPDKESPGILGATISVYKRLANLSFSLELMESESKGRVVSSPKIITENNKPATITSSDTRNIRTVTVSQGVTQEAFQPVSADVNLSVTPRVTNDGSIAMQVQITKSGFSTDVADALPNQVTRSINTNVLVNNGSTVVIGGLYQTETREIQSGIPFLKDLPLLGWLFKSAYNPNRNRSEMIVFLTPRIINQEEAGLVNREMDGIGI
jgi:type IV pilus assembly protein PilQ